MSAFGQFEVEIEDDQQTINNRQHVETAGVNHTAAIKTMLSSVPGSHVMQQYSMMASQPVQARE